MPAPDRPASPGPRFDEAGDATRRTRLANERTYLAWWRTGLTAFAVSIGSGKLVPVLAPGATWPYTAVGVGFAVLGVVCSGYAFRRHRGVEQALGRGEFVQPDARVIALLSGVAALLGALLIAALVTEF